MEKKVALEQVDVARMAKELRVSPEEIVFAFYVGETFEEWSRAYDAASRGSEEEKAALAKMIELAETFEEWHRVYRSAPSGSEEKKAALAKMMDLAETNEEQRILLHECTSHGSEKRKEVIWHLARFYEK